MSEPVWEVLMAKGYDPLSPPSKAEVLAAMERAPVIVVEVLLDVLRRGEGLPSGTAIHDDASHYQLGSCPDEERLFHAKYCPLCRHRTPQEALDQICANAQCVEPEQCAFSNQCLVRKGVIGKDETP